MQQQSRKRLHIVMDKVDIPFGRPWIGEQEKNAVMEVLDGHILTHGPKCKEFEAKFVQMMGAGFAVTTSSCMAALHLAAIYFDLKPGDEVIVPAQTHVATVHAVDIMQATPVFVDCELETGNIDISKLEAAMLSIMYQFEKNQVKSKFLAYTKKTF